MRGSNVGLQGVAIAERAYQQARDYARTARAGQAGHRDRRRRHPIIHHPDVRRMLLAMRAQIEAMRALAYYTAGADRPRPAPPRRRDARASQRRVDLLIPVVKAWCTDRGVEIASLGVQVHGGMGFIEETGAAQHLRDARIAPIYEGTNGIQANDLVGRKLLRDGGAAAARADRGDARRRRPADRALAAGIDALDERERKWLVAHAKRRAADLARRGALS